MSTHNIFEYGDKKDFRRQTLETMLRHLKEILESKKCNMIPATEEDIAQAFRKICPIEKAPSPDLKLKLNGRS